MESYPLRGSWLAQLVEQVTLDLRVVKFSPMLGIEILKIKSLKIKKRKKESYPLKAVNKEQGW